MINDTDKQMMFKFLQRNYPVSRFKVNVRFKRGILLDDGTIYFLNKTDNINKSHIINLFTKILNKIFICDDTIAKNIVKTYLNIN